MKLSHRRPMIQAQKRRLKRIALTEWGDVPITIETREWEDGDFEVKVFHTVDHFDPPRFVEKSGRVVFLYHHNKETDKHYATIDYYGEEGGDIVWIEDESE